MEINKGVLIIAELQEGDLASISGELLGIGRKLADDLGQDLSAVLIGSGVHDLADSLIALGADRVYVIDNPLFLNYVNDSYVMALENLIKNRSPEIVLMGQTSMGRDLASRLAFRLGTGITLDCVDLNINPDSKILEKTKYVYGGNAMAIYACEHGRPQMATIRMKVMDPLEVDLSRKGEVIDFDPSIDETSINIKVLDYIKEKIEGVKLEDANVVVCGGRGIGGADAFESLKDLAALLGGAIGGTRPACDLGWIPSVLQIGLTGKIVNPTIYLAIALSGSSQHQAGMSGSKYIIAINKDQEANIFSIAHYGVVGDYNQVLPTFIDSCRRLLDKPDNG